MKLYNFNQRFECSSKTDKFVIKMIDQYIINSFLNISTKVLKHFSVQTTLAKN